MLLRHTPKEIIEREALTINPAKTCQPIGAMYAALGVHKCLPHSHGSQGCCAYHRSALTRHYKEPVMAATSSFTEGASVFGGQANLLQAIGNIFSIYDPEIIAAHTTCLSETIGDDLPQIAAKAQQDGKIPPGKTVVTTSTPSYVGSHITGFSNMLTSFVTQLSESTGIKEDKINIIPGWVEPADMAEIKRICLRMGIKITMLPDTDGVLNTPQTGKYEMYPKGGTKVRDIIGMGDNQFTIGLGKFASMQAARALDTKCKVPCDTINLPIGLTATDEFIDKLRTVAGASVPDGIQNERGQLLDVITDMHQYLFGKKVALYGDPDQLISLAQFFNDLDMKVTHIVTGTPGKKFEKRMKAVLGDQNYNLKCGSGADMFLLHQWIKNEPVDLLVGNTYGKYISRDENIPLLRVGFPIYDRVGHQYFPTVGYRGALRLVEKMLDIFMSIQDRDAKEESFELVM
jgi:nitrogenase molybdenum-iron protein beta chain